MATDTGDKGQYTQNSASDATQLLQEFLQADYFKKVDYLTGQFDRMWSRFNFFLSFETALFAGFGVAWKESLWLVMLILIIVGFVSSVLWAKTSSEDRTLVVHYREQEEGAFNAVSDALAPCKLPPNYPSVGQPRNDPSDADWFSATRLPKYVSLLFCLAWLLAVALLFFEPA
jgi:hypothetical protein